MCGRTPRRCRCAWRPGRSDLLRLGSLRAFGRLWARDGLTEDEIAEVIYHSSGYAGFPAANTACKIAREVFDVDS